MTVGPEDRDDRNLREHVRVLRFDRNIYHVLPLEVQLIALPTWPLPYARRGRAWSSWSKSSIQK